MEIRRMSLCLAFLLVAIISHSSVQNDTKKNFAIIQTQLDKLVELLEKQSSKVSNNHGLNMTEEDSMFNITKIGNVKFPMETKDEMDHLERKLLEKDVMKNLVKKLSETCGTSGTAKICKIGLPLMKCLITDELLNQFTWKGIKGSSKMAFVQYVKIRELFYKVAHLADTSCSFNDSDSFIQHSAIKHSGQRMKRRISSSENKMNVKKTKKETNNNEKDKSKIDEEKSECRGLKTNKESTDDNCREKVDYLNALELQTIDDDDCGLKNKKESTDDNCREVNKENVDYLNAKKLQTFDNGCREVNKQNIDSFNAEKQQKFDVDCHGLKDNKEILDEYSSDVNDEITDTSNTLKLQESTIKTIVKEAEARHSTMRREIVDDFYQDDGASDNENELNDEAGDEDGDSTQLNITIITKPESYFVPAGMGVRLECRLDNDSPEARDMVHWKKGDVTLYNLGVSMLDANKYTLNGTDLVINNLSAADRGVYQCLVEAQKPKPMVEHRVTVLERPKVIAITASDDGKPAYGTDLTLTCTVTGNPAPEIVWTRTGWQNGSMNERLGNGSTITIKNVKEKESGKYFCYAVADKFSDTKTIDVFVQKKHRLHLRKTVINSAIGVKAIMECTVHEDGPVTISWHKGDQRIDSAFYTTQGKHSNLTIVPQTDDDFGTYTCRAESNFGSHNRSTVLVERPVVENLESDGQKLAWTVHSHQPLKSIEIQLIDTANGTPTILTVPVPDHKTHEYDMSYFVDSSEVKPGSYEVVVKVENTKGVSEINNQLIFEQIETSVENTRTLGASSFGLVPDAAHVHHPTTALITTVLMYLLVRMM